MNPLKYWPWAVFLGLIAFSFYLLGPLASGLLLFITAGAVMARLLKPLLFLPRLFGFFLRA